MPDLTTHLFFAANHMPCTALRCSETPPPSPYTTATPKCAYRWSIFDEKRSPAEASRTSMFGVFLSVPDGHVSRICFPTLHLTSPPTTYYSRWRNVNFSKPLYLTSWI